MLEIIIALINEMLIKLLTKVANHLHIREHDRN